MAIPNTLLLASCLCVGMYACMASGFVFLVTFVVSLFFWPHVLSPEVCNAIVGPLDTWVEEQVHRSHAFITSEYASIVNDVQVLREIVRAGSNIDNNSLGVKALALVAALDARIEERVRRIRAIIKNGVEGLKKRAQVARNDFMAAISALFFWLQLIVAVVNLVATVFIPLAYKEVLGYLRRRSPLLLRSIGVTGIRSQDKQGDDAAGSKDTSLLIIWLTVIHMYCLQVFVISTVRDGILSWVPCLTCFVALCGFAILEAERIYLWDSYEFDNGKRRNSRQVSDATGANQTKEQGEAGGATTMDEGRTWVCLWMTILGTYCIETCALYIMLGPHPAGLCFLALCNLAILQVAKQVYLSDEGESIDARASTDDANRGVDKWPCVSMAVFAMYCVKSCAIYLVLGPSLAGVSLVMLCSLTIFELSKEISLLDLHDFETEHRVDLHHVMDAPVVEEVDEVMVANSSTEDVHDGGEEGCFYATEEPVHDEERHLEEYSLDGWDVIQLDKEMLESN